MTCPKCGRGGCVPLEMDDGGGIGRFKCRTLGCRPFVAIFWHVKRFRPVSAGAVECAPAKPVAIYDLHCHTGTCDTNPDCWCLCGKCEAAKRETERVMASPPAPARLWACCSGVACAGRNRQSVTRVGGELKCDGCAVGWMAASDRAPAKPEVRR